MSSTSVAPRAAGVRSSLTMLVGSGDRIALFTLPFVIVGAAVNLAYPSLLAVDGSAIPLRPVALVALGLGLVIWAWSVVLILTRVPRGELITGGPFALVRHPLYASVALLVLPFAGLLLNTWLGAVIGLGIYLGARRYAPAEELDLARRFGTRWEAYRRTVLLPWL